VQIGDSATEYRGTHSCGDPTWVLPEWLRHATADGGMVPAGTVVTCGTWCGLLIAQPGELVSVEFDGIGKASVQV
ncbi:MAG: fumarylacetoacetate hydrolase family protein, partial [Rhizobacter sp.]